MPDHDRPIRPKVLATTPRPEAPALAWRRAAAEGEVGAVRHDALLAEATCMAAVEVAQPPVQAAPPARLRVAAWNLERCKHVEESAARLAEIGADVCLLTEMDFGMARASNRHTTADLARALGMGHAYGVEFIELGLGDAREQADHAGEENQGGLHGNAVVTRFAIDRAALLPLDAGGLWFTEAEGNDQRRIGGRMAVAVRHLLPGPVWFVSAHYESRLGPADRERETVTLIAHLDALCGDEPVVLAGDFNCAAIAAEGLSGLDVLARPEAAEPMFARLSAAGFGWEPANTPEPTTRAHPWSRSGEAPKKIDWFFARGVSLSAPKVTAAVGPDGSNLSDHEMISVDCTLQDDAR